MTPEQAARDLLEHLEHPRAQEMTAGDVVELANLISEVRELREALRKILVLADQCDPCGGGGPFGCDPISKIATNALAGHLTDKA